MLSVNDRRNVVKTSRKDNLLVQELVNSGNPLLTDMALEILQKAMQIAAEIKPYRGITRQVEDNAKGF